MDWANAVQQIHTLLSQLPRARTRHDHHPRSTPPPTPPAAASRPWPAAGATKPPRPGQQPSRTTPTAKASTRNAATLPPRQLAPPGPPQARAEASGERTEQPDPRRIAYAAEDRRRRISCDGRGAAVVAERDPERRPAEFLIADSPSSLSLPNRRDLLGLWTGPARRRSAAPRRRGDRLDAKHVKRLRRLPSRHFGDTANRDVTVAFSGTAVTVLMALAPEGE